MSDETGRESDTAPPRSDPPSGAGESRPRRRQPGPKLVRTGLAVLSGAPTMRSAALQAGYSEATVHNAGQNGLTAPRAVRAALEADRSIDPSRLKRKLLRVISEHVDDPSNRDRAQVAVAGFRVLHDAGVDETITGENCERPRLLMRRLIARIVRRAVTAAHRDPGQVKAMIAAIESKIEGLTAALAVLDSQSAARPRGDYRETE